LARLGFADPKAAARDLEQMGLWPAPDRAGQGARRLVRDIADCAHPEAALRALRRLGEQPGGAAVIELLRRRPGFRSRMLAVLGASISLGESLAASPDEAELLADGAAFARPRRPEALRRDALEAVCAAGWAQGLAAIRNFKRRQTLRVAVRDLAGAADLVETVRELSALAEACLEAGLALATARTLEESGFSSPPCRFGVIGMGKLGGSELNYHSDIDVMFVFEPVAGLDSDALGFATKVSERLLEALSAVTPEGAAFRVDANLRPEGKHGPLARSLDSYRAYWERWAQTWEFQSLIKARPVAGDVTLGQEFMRAATPFVYPERLAPEAVAEVRRMKARVESSQPARAGGERQVKLGRGGIRDVEFSVQLLQMVHGRHDESLRSGTTLEALRALAVGGYVGEEDASELSEAYVFLRTVEHRLQLAQSRRTHTIPEDALRRTWLARTMGFRDTPEATALDAFESRWRRVAGTVRALHEKLFYRPLLEAFGAVPAGLDSKAAAERLEVLGYRHPDVALRHLEAMTSGVSRRARVLRTMLPVMLDWLAEAPDPDGGLAALRTLAEAMGDRPSFLGALRDNPPVAELACRILGSSQLLADFLVRSPETFAALSDLRALREPKTREDLVGEAMALLDWQAGLDAQSEALRRFKRREFLRTAIRDLAGLADIVEVGGELSALAEACLEAGLALATARTLEESGLSSPPCRFGVIGMGKLGGSELNYHSDIDVMFVFEPVAGLDSDALGFATKVSERLLEALSAVTREGAAFRVDANLRPEGKHGPLARSLDSYRAYWERWAQTWEFQALIKARPVAGDVALGQEFMRAATPFVYPERLAPEAVAEVRRMKARVEKERLPAGQDPRFNVKLGIGGLADVEWTVQLLQMRNGGGLGALRVAGTLDGVEALRREGLLPGRDADWLVEAARFLNRVRNLAFLASGRAEDSLPRNVDEMERLARIMGYSAPGRQAFLEDYRRITRRCRQVTTRHFYGTA